MAHRDQSRWTKGLWWTQLGASISLVAGSIALAWYQTSGSRTALVVGILLWLICTLVTTWEWLVIRR